MTPKEMIKQAKQCLLVVIGKYDTCYLTITKTQAKRLLVVKDYCGFDFILKDDDTLIIETKE